MMTFQIDALDPQDFFHLFDMDDATLAEQNARRVRVETSPGYPCRLTLEDAKVGEEVILLNYTHQPAPSAFQASHAIYVRQTGAKARPAPGEVPAMMALRLASVRGFDARDEICKADVVPGETLAKTLEAFFEDPTVHYVHIHNAKLGCFTASARRVAAT